MVHEKNSRVSLSALRNSVIHKIFSEFLQPSRDFGTKTDLTVLSRGIRFYLVLDFWLAWSTGVPVLSVLDTDTG